jgi:WD40 repeat protein
MRLLAIVLCSAAASCVQAADDAAPAVSFRDQVAPILVRRCLGCHSDRKAQGGLNLKTLALFKKGGKTAGTDIVVPGDPEASYLVEAIGPEASPRMPYKQPPLSASEIRLIERWVAEGAKFDGGSETDTALASLVDPLKGLPKVTPGAPATDPVSAVVYSPDGRWLAAGRGREVRVFDAATGKPVMTLADHPGPITAIRFTPDGQTLIATGGRPGQFGAVTIWDVQAQKRRHDQRGHDDAILAAALSPDGKTLATASYDKLVKLWDVATGKEKATLKEHTDAVHAVAFSPDGRTLGSAGADRTVKLWEVASGRRRISLSDATAEQYAVRFSPDGKTVLAGGVDRTIRAWTIGDESATLVRSAIAHEGAIVRLIIAPLGGSAVAYSAGEDRAVKAWDLGTLAPRAALPGQPDWPLDIAASPDGRHVAVGRYDGSLVVHAAESGKPELTLLEPEAPPKPQLVNNASLGPPAPRGATRGKIVRVTLSGTAIESATAVVFAETGISATIVPAEKPVAGTLTADFAIAPDARPGLHRFWVQTPKGVPAAQNFDVSAYPEVAGAEPDNDAASIQPVMLPATLLGAIDSPGDIDHFRFQAKAGQSIVASVLARPLGSSLDAALAVVDDSGRVLGESAQPEGGEDAHLVFRADRDGTYALRIVDEELGGSANHFYRITAGPLGYLDAVFPLGVESGKDAPIGLVGVSLAASERVQVNAQGVGAGTILDVAAGLPVADRPINSRRVIAAAGSQAVESEGNDTPEAASALGYPGGVSGRIDKPGDVDHFRFEARKGRRVAIEVFGRRLGTPVDPVIEVLDMTGRPVPRAVLRPSAETNVAFRDHPSSGRNIRLTQWADFAEGDFVLIGREVSRIAELPRNPDDDAIFWGLGHPRYGSGARIGLLGTTAEYHPLGQPIYKVEIHPPGTTFAPGGLPAVTVNYRNDDGGPDYGKDSWLLFDAPADGSYIVRVEDVRGLGGPLFGYHLILREPRPDFRLSLSSENPNVPRGGATLVTASISRLDDFDGPVDVVLEHLPSGITATPARIDPGTFAADLVLIADATAPTISPATFTATGRGIISGPEGTSEIVHTIDPGGTQAGWITVTSEPNLKIRFSPSEVVIHPGQRVEMTLAVDRSPAFAGRVPIDVRNLPRGVLVLNIGLNGVLVTEQQTERSIAIYAEPWARPQERPFYALGKCEAAGTEHSSAPIRLIVRTQ